jgi:hypothetical protein
MRKRSASKSSLPPQPLKQLKGKSQEHNSEEPPHGPSFELLCHDSRAHLTAGKGEAGSHQNEVPISPGQGDMGNKAAQ